MPWKLSAPEGCNIEVSDDRLGKVSGVLFEDSAVDAAPGGPSVSPVAGDDEPRAEFGLNDEADLGGRTLLSRAPAPKGRRSLFRR